MTTPITAKDEPDAERLEACRAYVQAVLDYGDDLDVTFRPKWMGGSRLVSIGRHLNYENNGKPEPKAHYDFTTEELVAVLGPLGKVHDWRDKMPWRFSCPAENMQPLHDVVGRRLKEARQALELPVFAFYAPSGMTERTAKKWETGDIPGRFIAVGERRFEALSEAHGIPLAWLLNIDRLQDLQAKPEASEAA